VRREKLINYVEGAREGMKVRRKGKGKALKRIRGIIEEIWRMIKKIGRRKTNDFRKDVRVA